MNNSAREPSASAASAFLRDEILLLRDGRFLQRRWEIYAIADWQEYGIDECDACRKYLWFRAMKEDAPQLRCMNIALKRISPAAKRQRR
jgi:hypothetical protein